MTSRAVVTPVLLGCLAAVITVMYALPSARAEAPRSTQGQWVAPALSSAGGSTIGLIWLGSGVVLAVLGVLCLLATRRRLQA